MQLMYLLPPEWAPACGGGEAMLPKFFPQERLRIARRDPSVVGDKDGAVERRGGAYHCQKQPPFCLAPGPLTRTINLHHCTPKLAFDIISALGSLSSVR